MSSSWYLINLINIEAKNEIKNLHFLVYASQKQLFIIQTLNYFCFIYMRVNIKCNTITEA